MTMSFEKILSELDAFPELGMDKCQATLLFTDSKPVTLLYEGGKLVSATLLTDQAPVDITANAVMMNGVLREIPTPLSVMVQGEVASKLPLTHIEETDRVVAFQMMPEFDFWAGFVYSPTQDAKVFSNDQDRRLWLEQVGFRTILSYDVLGSRGLRQLTQALQDGGLGPLPSYVRTDSLAIKGVSVYSGVYEVKIPQTGE